VEGIQTNGVAQAAGSSRTSKATLNPPTIKSIQATSEGAVRLLWSKVKKGTKYVVYRSVTKTGNYKKIGMTKKTSYTDKTGKAFQTYYYKVTTVGKNNAGKRTESKRSKPGKATVRKQAKKTAYVGDSIFTGFPLYGVLSDTDSHRVFAKIGINPQSFLSSDLMSGLLGYDPDRVFLMLGVNSLAGNATTTYIDYILKYYQKIVDQCLNKNPNMEVILIGVAPVSSGASVSLSAVHQYNQALQKLFGTSKYKKNVHYCSLDHVLGDGNGYLRAEYSGGDGIHWNRAAYVKVLSALDAYVKEL
jgi:lysophospholipase L1-like esterase